MVVTDSIHILKYDGHIIPTTQVLHFCYEIDICLRSIYL
jgi:hypothetical protein